jgi:hypothetical protein
LQSTSYMREQQFCSRQVPPWEFKGTRKPAGPHAGWPVFWFSAIFHLDN